MMTNLEILEIQLSDLRLNLAEINASAWPKPSDIKTAVNATFQILEILIHEAKNRG